MSNPNANGLPDAPSRTFVNSRIRRREQLWTARQWITRAGMLTVVIPLCTGLVVSVGRWGPVILCLLIGLAIALVSSMIVECKNAYAAWTACAFGAYVGAIVYATLASVFGLSVTFYGRHVDDLAVFAACVLVCAFLYVSMWMAIRVLVGPIRILDATQCSRCGYLLIGNESGICPECGTAQKQSDTDGL